MGLSVNTYTYTGGTQRFDVSFTLGFLSRADVRVRINDAIDGDGDPVYSGFAWIDDTEIEVTPTLTSGDTVEVSRTVSKTALQVDFDAGADVTKANLNAANLQVMMLLHEIIDQREDAGLSELLDLTVAEATAALEALETAAGVSATAAAASASAASTSETNAATSAATATTQATQSSNEATNAATSAAAAATSATNAGTSETNAAASEADINTKWLGSHANDAAANAEAGGTPATGAIYYNTASLDLLVYNGTAWAGFVGGTLAAAANLSDLANAATARSNLGVGIGVDVQAYSATLAGTQQSFTTALKDKLDAIEATADVTDATNVTAAGALMDSECASPSAVKTTTAAFTTAYKSQLDANTGTFTSADETKLDGISTSADVTDYTTVSGAGALMDAECVSVSSLKAINQGLTTNSQVRFNELELANGTAAAPPLNFTGSTNSGFYFTNGGLPAISYNGTGRTEWASAGFRPVTDNAYDCGTASNRWDDIRATNGTIVTSDGRTKQDVEELDVAEQRVAVRVKGLIRTYRLITSVEAKGEDARKHFGVIAQDVIAAFAAEGLDAHAYGVICLDELDDGTTRYGVRYDQLLALCVAAL